MLVLGRTPRILITRLSAIGDCIHCTPVATALRRRFPDAFIAWATQSGPASLLEGHEGIDVLIRVDRNWMKRWSSIRQVRRALQDLQFDVAVDPQSLTKSSALGWLSGAKHRIGFGRGQARECSPWLNNHLVRPTTTHVVDRYLELLKPLGIETSHAEFSIPRFAHAAQRIEAYLDQQAIGKFALLNPGAGWNSKRWPHQRYAAVAKYLSAQYGLASIVLWAGDREKQWATEIASQAAAKLAPDTTLPELAELCRRASLFVGSDTGPMHLAAAVQTPCIAMYGPTRIEVCGPYGHGHRAIQAYLQEGSSKQRRGDDNSAMRAISIDAILQACDFVVKNRAA